MYTRDIRNNLAVVQLLAPQDTKGATTNSASVDTKGYGACGIVVSVGALTGEDATNYVSLAMQESDQADAGFADVDSTDLIGAFASLNAAGKANSVQFVGYRGTKRYLRVVATKHGTTVSASIIGANAILGHAETEPVGTPTVTAAA